MTEEEASPHVFISYCDEDSEIADRINLYLRNANYKVGSILIFDLQFFKAFQFRNASIV